MGKGDLVAGVTKPLGFFVLALLIVETFLATVLVFSNQSCADRFLGILIGVILFVFVVSIVAIIVWCRPTHIIYGEKAHLTHEKIYGTKNKPQTKPQILVIKERSEVRRKVKRK